MILSACAGNEVTVARRSPLSSRSAGRTKLPGLTAAGDAGRRGASSARAKGAKSGPRNGRKLRSGGGRGASRGRRGGVAGEAGRRYGWARGEPGGLDPLGGPRGVFTRVDAGDCTEGATPGRGTPRWRNCAANSSLSASNALRNELRADEGASASKRAPRRPGPAKLATDGLDGERRKRGARGMAGRGGGVRGGLPGGVAGERRAQERTIDGTSDGAAVERRDERRERTVGALEGALVGGSVGLAEFELSGATGGLLKTGSMSMSRTDSLSRALDSGDSGTTVGTRRRRVATIVITRRETTEEN